MQGRILPRSRAARARHGARPRSEGKVSERLRIPRGNPNLTRSLRPSLIGSISMTRACMLLLVRLSKSDLRRISMRLLASVLASFVVALLTAVPAQAELVLAVNEGVTYYVTPAEIREKYKDLADLLGKQLKTTVRVVPVDQYPVLRKGLDEQQYDLAFVHPAHHSLVSLRDGKYRLVVLTKGYTEYKARFFVSKDAKMKQPEDMKGKRFGMPDPDSITAVITRATMRDLGIDSSKAEIRTTRYQDAVPFFVENGFSDVGVSASGAVVKQWQEKGRLGPPFLFQESPALTRGRVSRPRAHCGEQRGGEAAAVLYQVEKRVAVDREQFAVAFRDGACETRRAIDQRHFAEQLPRAQILHQVAADADRHSALEDHVHQHPDLAFPHDGGPGFVAEIGVGTEHAPEIFDQVLAERRRFPPLASGHGRPGAGEPADGFAQAADHDAHQHESELRVSPEGCLELPVVEPDDAASGFRHGCPGARPLVDRRHLAEDLARPDRGHGFVSRKYADFAVEEEVHAVRHEQKRNALLVFGEDLPALGEALGSAGEAEKLHRHRSVIGARGTALADHLVPRKRGSQITAQGREYARPERAIMPPGMSSGRVHFSRRGRFPASATTLLDCRALRARCPGSSAKSEIGGK